MEIFGGLLLFAAIVGIIIFPILGLVSLFKKNGKAKRNFKLLGGSFAVMVLSIILISATSDSSKTASKSEKPAKQEKVVKETPEQKAEREAKAKAEAEAKKKKVKQAYLKEIKPEIDQHIKVYDDNWNKIWQPTMTAISKGNTDYYTAYNNMQVIKDHYEGGRIISLDPVQGMSKADRKLLDTYGEKMGEAFSFRCMAVDIAQEGFNTGNITPENVNKIQSYTQMADNSMIEAVAAVTTIEVDLGIKR
ncbi:hypothetical protein ABE288_20550 [Bacillus salipaludis]|uniref:hypothetical protein n=1 Tax=Bacillus salipaludis TaxID=2547811 RepID=UPI003D1B0A6D